MVSEGFAKGFDSVVSKMGWQYDPAARVLYLPSWWRWNGPSNPNEMKGRLKGLDELPETELEIEAWLRHPEHRQIGHRRAVGPSDAKGDDHVRAR